MSGLARLLAGHTPPGVYHWSSAADAARVQHAVEIAGWRFVGLDTWAVEDKAGFLEACQRSFGFPAYFGRNFDALADSLSDVRAGDLAGVVVLWDGWGPLARADEHAFEVAVDIFAQRVEFERGGPFAVLLKGVGPETDLPELDPHVNPLA